MSQSSTSWLLTLIAGSEIKARTMMGPLELILTDCQQSMGHEAKHLSKISELGTYTRLQVL